MVLQKVAVGIQHRLIAGLADNPHKLQREGAVQFARVASVTRVLNVHRYGERDALLIRRKQFDHIPRLRRHVLNRHAHQKMVRAAKQARVGRADDVALEIAVCEGRDGAAVGEPALRAFDQCKFYTGVAHRQPIDLALEDRYVYPFHRFTPFLIAYVHDNTKVKGGRCGESPLFFMLIDQNRPPGIVYNAQSSFRRSRR